MSRLALFLGSMLWLTAGACRREVTPPAPPVPAVVVTALPSASGTPTPPQPAAELTWRYAHTAMGPMQVVISVPPRPRGNERFPVLITMHGKGESLKGPTLGARGWVDDYWLPRATARLAQPPLHPQDFLGMVARERLAAINHELERAPYRGLVVVCPYTPDILFGARPFELAEPLAAFLVDELLTRVRRELPVLPGAEHAGIDGVSLGGRSALLVGLLRPEAFGTVATLQPAFDTAEAPALASRAVLAVRKNPTLRLRLVTSSGDYYLRSTRAIASEFRAAGVEPHLLVAQGGHSYEFNRGPGALEMLLWHDRTLRGEPAL